MATLTEKSRLLGHVGWDGSEATSERVILRASLINRRYVERNHYVRIDDREGERSGFLARVISGPFFHRAGSTTVTGLKAESSMEGFLLVELEVQGELIENRCRDTNSRPMPGSSVFSLTPKEIAKLHGFEGDMLLGNVTGQKNLRVCLKSQNKGVLPRNLGIFGTVGSGKSNTTQVVIEEAARNGWAVIVVDVEGEYVDMDQPSEESHLEEKLTQFGMAPEGIADFEVFYPASCPSEKENAHPFTLRVADFDTHVIGDIMQVTVPERNALLDCVEHLQQKSRTHMATSEKTQFEMLLDSAPETPLPYTLQTLLARANERGPRGSEYTDYSGLAPKLNWLVHSEAFDLTDMWSLNPYRMMSPGRVSIIDVSIANDVIKNLVTADLFRKLFALKMKQANSPPVLLIIEEAHSFISRDREQTMQATLHMIQNVIRRGRKRWLSIAFVSQQPGHLPPEIFELCNTRLVHALRSTQNLEALMSTTGEVSRDLWARCPLLGPGQAVISSPQFSQSAIVSIRPAASRRRFTR